MRVALIEKGSSVVTNVIVADPEKDLPPEGFEFFALLDNDPVAPGWIKTQSGFTNPLPEPALLVPQSITRRQCALQLHITGMISVAEAKVMTKDGTPPAPIQAYFNQMTEEQRDLAEIDFAAMNYYRNNPLITTLMTANGLTTQDIDNFFIAAAQL